MVRAAYAHREQRKHPRRELHPKAAFAVAGGERIDVHCRDVSLGGAFLEAPKIAIFASEVTVYLEIEGHEIAIPSTVRWSMS